MLAADARDEGGERARSLGHFEAGRLGQSLGRAAHRPGIHEAPFADDPGRDPGRFIGGEDVDALGVQSLPNLRRDRRIRLTAR